MLAIVTSHPVAKIESNLRDSEDFSTEWEKWTTQCKLKWTKFLLKYNIYYDNTNMNIRLFTDFSFQFNGWKKEEWNRQLKDFSWNSMENMKVIKILPLFQTFIDYFLILFHLCGYNRYVNLYHVICKKNWNYSTSVSLALLVFVSWFAKRIHKSFITKYIK